MDTAPGTETLTGTAGFPATDGTQVALGSVASTSGTGSRYSCTLYQDIAIPAGTSNLVLTLDVGAKGGRRLREHRRLHRAALDRDAPRPGRFDARGAMSNVCRSSPDTTLVTLTKTFTVSGIAGTTVRLGIINAANVAGHEVIGIDKVVLTATVAN